MARVYDHQAIEKKWQKRWAEEKLYETPDQSPGKENFYALVEYPYPSGDLHMGHWYAFAVPDIFARMKRMQGKNVLFPIGFDAFGLPTENAAIQRKVDPAKWTYENIDHMRTQLHSIGASFDWTREVVTCDPSYYRWTQWLFLKFYERGLAYRGRALVNWDPVDKTVLANEQVLPDGTAERSGAKVEKKELEQWFFKITDYADRLLGDLGPLPWPESIKDSQRAWIGSSEGAEIDFPLASDTVKRFVLLHGRTGSSRDAFLPWLKGELERRGYAVQAPNLPNPDEPDDEEQADFAAEHCTFDKHTAVVGHSFGGVVALRLLERGIKFQRLTLVSTPFSGKFLDGAERHTVVTALEKGFNFEKIRKNARGFIGLYDTGDTVVPVEDGELFTEKLGAFFIRGNGVEPHFLGAREPDVLLASIPTVRIFTTRPDTILGATHLVLAPEHPWVIHAVFTHRMLPNNDAVRKYIEQARAKTERERVAEGHAKTGIRLEGIEALNPATREKLPVYVADYVLPHYGTGAIMAVPAHDERDREFAKAHDIPIKEAPLVDSKEIIAKVRGQWKTNYKLRDWLISRQRYWGSPIPIVYDPKGKAHPIPEKHLPWLLPTDVDFMPTGQPPLARSKELKERTEKIFGKGWRPETDTMDTFVESSWYFLRYLDPKKEKEFSSLERQKHWMPVARYSGGAEHTTVHLLYSRFFYKALFDMGLVTDNEPYRVRQNRGLILGEDGRKMSKRWGNVVNQDEQVTNVGADAVRTYLAFIGPYNEAGSYPWNTNGLVGVRRFLERVAGFFEKVSDAPPSKPLSTLLNQTIKKVGDDVESMKFNTAVSQLMILGNEFQKLPNVPRSAYEVLLKLLAPFAPHLSEELWEALGHKTSLHREAWPSFDVSQLATESVTLAVQVAGRTRGTVTVPRGTGENEVLSQARKNPHLARFLPEKPKRVIFVLDRILNVIP